MPDIDADDAVRGAANAPPGRRLQVRHDTSYRYQVAAALGYSLAWLAPRALPGHPHTRAMTTDRGRDAIPIRVASRPARHGLHRVS